MDRKKLGLMTVSLELRFLWISAATAIITLSSLVIFLTRHKFNWIYRYNASFLGLFGVEAQHVSWVRYLISWLLGTFIATVILTLLVNIADAIILLTGLSGILLDYAIFPLAIAGIVLGIFLVVAALIPVLAMPFACPTALGLITFLHLYGFHYVFGPPSSWVYTLSYISTFLYFGSIAIGFVGVFLSAYLLLRHYVGARILKRYQRISTETETLPSEETSS